MRNYEQHLDFVKGLPVDERSRHGIGDNPYFHLTKVPELNHPEFVLTPTLERDGFLYIDTPRNMQWKFTKPSESGYLWMLEEQLRKNLTRQFPYALIINQNSQIMDTNQEQLLQSLYRLHNIATEQNIGFVMPWSSGLAKTILSLDELVGYAPTPKPTEVVVEQR